jgi:O-antigen ligase/tetratricopeptide (TPR) repeat protein
MTQFLRMVVMGGIFVIPALTLLVSNNLFFPFITGKNFSFRIIVEIIFAGWLILALFEPKYRPQWSWVLVAFTALTGYMLVASIFAYHPHTALWSNFERMDGFIMLVHVWMYVVVLASMLRTKNEWWWFLHTSLVVSLLVVFNGLSQLSGNINYRIDSTLGNSTYMAVYMLFHIGIVGYLALQAKTRLQQVGYALFGLLFLLVLIQTGTRGAVLGFAVGSIVTIAYVAILGWRYPQTRKVAIAGIAAIFLAGLGFYSIKDSAPIQNNPTLARIANINLNQDLEIRRVVWGMAWEGIKERPLMGWGIGNYNYVFNQNYDPRMYAQEQWFDRVHNIVLDWLVYGGFVGLLFYASVFGALGYYLVYRPWRYDEQKFTVLEQALLVGLLVAYILHNMVVFDNLISYIFFAVVMALIHFRVATPWQKIESIKVSPIMIHQLYAPLIIVVAVGSVYVLNLPHRAAAKDVVVAIQSDTVAGQLRAFERALSRNSFGHQEVVEQFVLKAVQLTEVTNIDPALKQRYIERAESELQKMIANKPNDARLHVFAANYYRAAGKLDRAAEELAIARELSPRKQSVIMQQGANAMAQADTEKALEFFRDAFLLDERYNTAREYYVALLFDTGDRDTALTILEAGDEAFQNSFAKNEYVISLLTVKEEFDLLKQMFTRRLQLEPKNMQDWASLAFVSYQQNNIPEAIATLTSAAEEIPSFAPFAACVSANLEAGKAPEEGCN